MNQKYELIADEFIENIGKKLYRIRALKNFGDVKAGDLGGYVEQEKNLSHEGDAWISGEACAHGRAQVLAHAKVSDLAEVGGDARICGNAEVFGRAQVFDRARVS